MNYKNSKGFTLIELLVVIAIIGILASVVLASIGSARSRGVNSSIKVNMKSIANQISLTYRPPYENTLLRTTCPVPPPVNAGQGSPFYDPIVAAALIKIQKDLGESDMPVFCASDAVDWAVSVKLKISENGFTHWCIDSSGKAKHEMNEITSPICD